MTRLSTVDGRYFRELRQPRSYNVLRTGPDSVVTQVDHASAAACALELQAALDALDLSACGLPDTTLFRARAVQPLPERAGVLHAGYSAHSIYRQGHPP